MAAKKNRATLSLRRSKMLMRMEESIMEQSVKVLEYAMHFAEITPEMEEPPEMWRVRYGEEAAQERFRIAKIAWMGGQSVPFGLTLAKGVLSDIVKAQAIAISTAAAPASGYRDGEPKTTTDVDAVNTDEQDQFEELVIEDATT